MPLLLLFAIVEEGVVCSKVHDCVGIAKIRLAMRFPYNNKRFG
jgi:hypothetical protein